MQFPPNPPVRGLFVAGTDTGVGKTRVTCAAARCLREQGVAFGVSKPVATGAEWVDGRWLGDDTRQLAAAAGSGDPVRITPWSFPEPAAPPVAARRHGIRLTLGGLAEAVMGQAGSGVVLVEGVGGLLCPLTDAETVADLVALLRLPMVLVTRGSLGTLSHTLMAAEVAAHRGLALRGVIVNHTSPPDDVAAQTNADELRKRLRVPVLAEVPFDPRNDSPAALQAVPWRQLIDGVPPG